MGIKRLHAASIMVMAAASLCLGGCESSGFRYKHIDVENDTLNVHHNPTPGELAAQAMEEDSIRSERLKTVKEKMENVLKSRSARFKDNYYTGYFLTDFDHDGIPELWIRTGNNLANANLELLTANAAGELVRSQTIAGTGRYFAGDDYLVQSLGQMPDVVNINKITIKNGEMEVTLLKQIDLLSDPDAKIPNFEEREIRGHKLTNLTPLRTY